MNIPRHRACENARRLRFQCKSATHSSSPTSRPDYPDQSFCSGGDPPKASHLSVDADRTGSSKQTVEGKSGNNRTKTGDSLADWQTGRLADCGGPGATVGCRPDPIALFSGPARRAGVGAVDDLGIAPVKHQRIVAHEACHLGDGPAIAPLFRTLSPRSAVFPPNETSASSLERSTPRLTR